MVIGSVDVNISIALTMYYIALEKPRVLLLPAMLTFKVLRH